MKITLSYTGGTARGAQLAREFARRGWLAEFYVPSTNRRVDFLPRWLCHTPASMVNTSLGVYLLRGLLRRTARLRRASPTERYQVCEANDHWVARSLQPGADILMAESQIALHTLRRARQLGMVTIVDRTNTHIVAQTEMMREENRRLGQNWEPNSPRVIEKGLREYAEADAIFVLSSHVLQTFIDQGVPADKVVCVPSGIDLGPFHPIEKTDDVFRVIYCGALQNKKGTHYLLDAFGALDLPNAELWLVGDIIGDDLQPYLMKYAGRYKHWGRIPNAELYRYYSQGSVFVLPSLEEGLAKVIIEAMACGLPVIATSQTGAEDIVRDGREGFVVPVRDPQAIQAKLAYLYAQPDVARQMGRNAQARVRAEFTLDRYIERLMTAFSGLMTTRGKL